MTRRTLSALAIVVLAGAIVAVAVAGPGPGPGRGMMGSYGFQGPMMGGVFAGPAQTSVTPAELRAVRDRVAKQLAASGYKGFAVAEIMAFTDNDYVLVEDASGKAAFELLADPRGRWLMQEPQSMMWNTSYGMLRPFRPGSGSPVSTPAEAKARANAWLAANRPGEATADATALPGYFTIDVAAKGAKVGMLSVNATSGAVWFHTWHGTFLADQDY